MKAGSIKKNFLMNIVLTMSSFIFPIITFPYISRVLLPVGTGKVQFATSVIAYFLMFSQMGAPSYGIRACAKVRDDKEQLTRTAHELLFFNLITSTVTYILLAIALIVVPKFQQERILIIVVSLTIGLTAIGMEWLYKALEQYTYITIRSVIFKLVAIVAMFLLVHTESDYVIYGGITILASSASNILNLINAHKYIGFKPVGGYNLKKHIKPIMVFFAMACATTIYTNLDNVMLGFMATDVDVGYYGTAVKIKNILVSIVTSLGAVLLPRVAYYVEHGSIEEFRRITNKALNFVMLLAVPFSVFFTLFAKESILLLSGSAYEGSIVPMQVIMPTLLLIGITNVFGIQILVPTGRERVVLYSEIAGAITDIVFNAILIPRMQSIGAAIGTLIAEFVVLIVQYRTLRGEMKEIVHGICYFNICFGVLLGTAASIWIKALSLGNFITLAIAAILFFGVYGLFLVLRKETMVMDILGQVINKVKGHKVN